jgi:hypothetical protein
MSVPSGASRARFAWLTLAVLLIAVIAGCTLKSGGYNTVSPPKIRFFNGGIDIGAVNVTIGTIQTVGLLTYETFSTYATAQTGVQPIAVSQSGGTTTLIQSSQDFENGTRFSYVLYGRPSAPAAVLVSDNVDLPGGGRFKVRLLNTATEMGPLDLYITPQAADLATVSPVVSGIALGASSDFVELDSGSFEVRITPQGSKTILYDSGQVTLSERNAYSIVAYSRADPALVNAGVFTMDTLGSGALLGSTLGQVRLVNATPATPAVDLSIEGTATITNVAYATASPYKLITTVGTRTITLQATGTSTPLLTGTSTFPPGGDTTQVVIGAAGAQQSFALQDINFLPMTTGDARVRVMNATTGGTTFNTLVNGTLTVGTLANASPSLYFELPPASYAFDFIDPTSSANLLSLPNVVLAAGHTYTIFVIGPPGQLTGLITQDR